MNGEKVSFFSLSGIPGVIKKITLVNSLWIWQGK